MTTRKGTVIGILVLLLVTVVVLGTAGCVSNDTLTSPTIQENSQTIQEKNNINWYNYDLKELPGFTEVNHTYNPKDNFYAYANAESIQQMARSAHLIPDFDEVLDKVEKVGDVHGGTSSVVETQKKLINRSLDAYNDPSISGTEAEVVRTVFKKYLDFNTRNKDGYTPILPAVEEIRKVSTLDELSSLISSGGKSSLKEAFVRENVLGSLQDGKVTVVELVPQEFVLVDPDAYKNMTKENAILYLYLLENFYTFLVDCGYSEEEAGNTVVALVKYEAEIAPLCNGLKASISDPQYYDKIDKPYTYEEFSKMAFPVAGDLKNYHDAGVTNFVVENPTWLNKLNELYTPENLEGFKASMLYNLYMTATPFLTTDLQNKYFNSSMLDSYPYLPQTPEFVEKMSTKLGELSKLYELNDDTTKSPEIAAIEDDIADLSKEPITQTLSTKGNGLAFNNIINVYLGMAIGKVMTDKYVPAGEKEKYTKIAQDVISGLKERIQKADWLSDSSRKEAINKLDNLKIRVLYPDDWSYYSYDDVDYKNAETLYDLSVMLRKHNQAELVKDALQEPSAAVWPKAVNYPGYFIPQSYNAFYYFRDNSINILYGFISPLIDNPSATTEDIYALAGTTIGHEITHGLDPTGSKFDHDGSYVNWWTDNDRKNFTEKEKKIADYYSGFEARPGEYLKGSNMTGEAIADLGGLAVTLDLARKINGFDYDRFFTKYGQAFFMPAENASYSVSLNNVHPPGMYRVNVNVQQFLEFYKIYNVIKGDQMYLAPENRLGVW